MNQKLKWIHGFNINKQFEEFSEAAQVKKQRGAQDQDPPGVDQFGKGDS